MNTPEQICRDCNAIKPLTGEFWYRDKSSKTGFARHRCRICSKKYMSTEARLERAQRRELETEEPEVLSSFDVKALAQEVKKPAIVYSMDREI